MQDTICSIEKSIQELREGRLRFRKLRDTIAGNSDSELSVRLLEAHDNSDQKEKTIRDGERKQGFIHKVPSNFKKKDLEIGTGFRGPHLKRKHAPEQFDEAQNAQSEFFLSIQDARRRLGILPSFSENRHTATKSPVGEITQTKPKVGVADDPKATRKEDDVSDLLKFDLRNIIDSIKKLDKLMLNKEALLEQQKQAKLLLSEKVDSIVRDNKRLSDQVDSILKQHYAQSYEMKTNVTELQHLKQRFQRGEETNTQQMAQLRSCLEEIVLEEVKNSLHLLQEDGKVNPTPNIKRDSSKASENMATLMNLGKRPEPWKDLRSKNLRESRMALISGLKSLMAENVELKMVLKTRKQRFDKKEMAINSRIKEMKQKIEETKLEADANRSVLSETKTLGEQESKDFKYLNHRVRDIESKVELLNSKIEAEQTLYLEIKKTMEQKLCDATQESKALQNLNAELNTALSTLEKNMSQHRLFLEKENVNLGKKKTELNVRRKSILTKQQKLRELKEMNSRSSAEAKVIDMKLKQKSKEVEKAQSRLDLLNEEVRMLEENLKTSPVS